MRLLDTWTGNFRWVDHPSTEHYAILSHVWDISGEQTYEDLRTLQQNIKDDSAIGTPATTIPTPLEGKRWRRLSLSWRWRKNIQTRRASATEVLSRTSRPPDTIFAHPLISEKIRNACAVARADGYRYIWIDSGCIDKSSSAELSAAVNSMFHWYRWADVCYAHLPDVADDDSPLLDDSQFRRSRWHKRGWTLQELIAPDRVVFLSQNWKLLGSKVSLAKVIEQVTGVDRMVLEDPTAVFSVSVARRMWWASSRETTRVEDEAYSLMGIFGVHIPAIYGEGRHAFVRLQQEILRAIPDQSLFAWGSCITDTTPGRISGAPDASYGLLASAPSDFAYSNPSASAHGYYDLLETLGLPMETPPPDFTITPYGIRARLLVIPSPAINVERHFFHTSFRPKYIALLGCTDDEFRYLTLPLCTPLKPSQSRNEHIVSFSPGAFVPVRVWPIRLDFLARYRHSIILADLLIRTGGFRPGSQSVRPTPGLGDKKVSNEVILRSWSQSHMSAMGYSVQQHRRVQPYVQDSNSNSHMIVMQNSTVRVTVVVTVGEAMMRPLVRVRYQTLCATRTGTSSASLDSGEDAVELVGRGYARPPANANVAFLSSWRMTFSITAPTTSAPRGPSVPPLTESPSTPTTTHTRTAHEWTITCCRFIDSDGFWKLGVEVDIVPTSVLEDVHEQDQGGPEVDDKSLRPHSDSVSQLPDTAVNEDVALADDASSFSASARFAHMRGTRRPMGPRSPRT
ncbi:HET-domain-containing protein [Dichomitus squalens]|uniref:HET-domain-containing protein n=1 Tax=Dichomitus squalens TaxID=114155 RepID=A0A4Q9NE18_9APHY|nr:HET-domain-containing protein [Dichomitus squalens]TBU60393.1 HET-domain-containing protein [Dichomitus squalens]